MTDISIGRYVKLFRQRELSSDGFGLHGETKDKIIFWKSIKLYFNNEFWEVE